MQKLVAGFAFLSLVCGPGVSAQENVSVNTPDARPQFPQSGYRPLPPHFQPRRVIAADLDKVTLAPPTLPSYEQPAIPADGYLWVPGFWAWRKSVPDYFWVPGTWVRPPQSGLVWTPPYWSRTGDSYTFHAGYWASQVGYYGEIEYGFGYPGTGYQGGRWSHGTFYYNRSFNNLGSVGIANAYGHASGRGDDSSRAGDDEAPPVDAAPRSQKENRSINPRHIDATFEQRRHFELAAMDRSLYSKQNGGAPAVAATPHAGVLAGDGITSSRRQPDQTAASDGNSHTDVPTSRSSWGEQPTAK